MNIMILNDIELFEWFVLALIYSNIIVMVRNRLHITVIYVTYECLAFR